jgi:CRISPR-associated protein (TIGR02710 family)
MVEREYWESLCADFLTLSDNLCRAYLGTEILEHLKDPDWPLALPGKKVKALLEDWLRKRLVMSKTKKAVLITVGSGTAGKYSNVAEGILSYLEKERPDLFMLAPSDTEESCAVADYIREGALERGIPGFKPYSSDSEYVPGICQDNLLDTQKRLVHAFRELDEYSEYSLAINPTSGTKQMSVAGVLAGLEASVDSIEFIVGERSQGVVKSGTERIEKISSERIFMDRDIALAIRFFHNLSYVPARDILRPYKSTDTTCELLYGYISIFYLWDIFQYGAAFRECNNLVQICENSTFEEILKPDLCKLRKAVLIPLKEIGQARTAGKYDSLYWGVVDMCANAEREYKRGRFTDCIIRLFRAFEIMVEAKLLENGLKFYGDSDDFEEESISQVLSVVGGRLRADLTDMMKRDSQIRLNLVRRWELLYSVSDPVADNQYLPKWVVDIQQARNHSFITHGNRVILKDETEKCLQSAFQAFGNKEFIPGFQEKMDICRFPNIARISEQFKLVGKAVGV